MRGLRRAHRDADGRIGARRPPRQARRDAWQAANFDHDMFRRSGLNVGFCVEIGLSGKEIRETGFSVSDWRDAGLAQFQTNEPFDLFDEPVYRVGVSGVTRRPIADTTTTRRTRTICSRPRSVSRRSSRTSNRASWSRSISTAWPTAAAG